MLAIIESRSITSDKVYSRKQIGETGKRKPRAGSIVLQTEQGRGSVIAGLLRVALSFRSRRKTGRLRLYIATAESDPKQPLRRLARAMKPPGAAFSADIFRITSAHLSARGVVVGMGGKYRPATRTAPPIIGLG